MERATIHLGYVMGSGARLDIPLGHMAVTGQTQLSGKTTTLEALADRSGCKVVVFRTKRSEGAFKEGHRIPPYFSERADWQFVAAILEATLREKLKFERAWIMRACKNAKTLADVQKNVRKAMEKAKGLSADVYMTLDSYLDLVVPQIERLPAPTAYTAGQSPRLTAGVNVMDLAEFSVEMQSLIIRSVLEWVYRVEEGVVTVIPEAWEFIPQNRASPVLLACETLIRKGGASRNYVWLDSQDIAGVHKNVLRSVQVWLLGVQREANELKRTLAHIPKPRPQEQDMMRLGRGEFFACFKDVNAMVYVQPAWLPQTQAIEIATCKMPVDAAHVWKPEPPRSDEEEDMGLHDELTQARDQNARLVRDLEDANSELRNANNKIGAQQGTIDTMKGQIARLEAALDPNTAKTAKELRVERPDGNTSRAEFGEGKRHDPPAVETIIPSESKVDFPIPAGMSFFTLYEAFRRQIVADPIVLKLVMSKPELQVHVEVKRVEVDENTPDGRIAKLMSEGWFDDPRSANAAMIEWRARGHSQDPRSVLRACDKMAALGFMRKTSHGYQMIPGMKVNVIER